MSEPKHIPSEDVANLDGRSYATIGEIATAWPKTRPAVKKWAKRKGLSFNDPRGGRESVVLVKDLPNDVRSRLVGDRTHEPSLHHEHVASPFARLLPFPLPSSEIPLLAPPGKYHDHVMRALQIVHELRYKAYQTGQSSFLPGQEFDKESIFIAALAAKLGKRYSQSTIRRIASQARDVFNDPAVGTDQKWPEIARRLIPEKHPGQSSRQYFADSVKRERGLKIYRDCNRCVTRAWKIYCSSLPEGEKPPSLRQYYTLVKHAPETEKLRGREAFKMAAGYIDRHYDDEFAGDAWCIDEWELDGVFYDEKDHSRLVNYGQGYPIAHILSIVDERTTYIMDWLLVWKESLEDATLTLAERMVRKFWLPYRLVADRAGRFRRLARGRVVLGFDGELIEALSGPLGELGVKPRLTKEANPRANRIERIHREYARRATEFGISWRGANVKERKTTDIDERVHRHLREHCKYGTCSPQLLSIQEAEKIVATWVHEINLAETRAKGCNGLSRQAAFNYFRPSQEERACRKRDDFRVDLAFAERDERVVQAGGVIQLRDGNRYSHLELVAWTGQKLRTCRYRHDISILHVYPPGQEGSLLGHLRRAVGVNEPEVLSEQIGKLEHARKVLAREEKPLPMQPPDGAEMPLPVDPRKFFAPAEHPEETDPIKPLPYFGKES